VRIEERIPAVGWLFAEERLIMIRPPYWRHVTLISTASAKRTQHRSMQMRICEPVEA
jgi:hypothetical protein